MSITNDPKYSMHLRHDYCLKLKKSLKAEAVLSLSQDLTQQGFNCYVREEEEGWIFFIGLNDTKIMLEQAEKQLVLCNFEETDPQKRKIQLEKLAQRKKYLPNQVIHAENKRQFQFNQKEKFEQGNYDKILSEAEKSRIFYHILDKVEIASLKDFRKDMNLKDGYEEETLIYYLKRIQAIEEIFPLFNKARIVRAAKEGHNEVNRSLLQAQSKQWWRCYVDVNLIREFYGADVAIYHSWMQHLFNWLCFPATLAIVVSVTNHILYSEGNSPISAIYSAVMVFWGTLYVISWRRHCRGLAVTWDDYVLESDGAEVRKEFTGQLKIDPVTDQPSTSFTFWQRLPRYVVSFVVCAPCLLFALFVIVCFLNMTGAIRPDHHGGAFDMPMLSKLADPGAIFDPESNINILGGILQAVVTQMMNIVFCKIAKQTTEYENHKYQNKYENSIFIKRFVFEFTDCHLPHLYIGIYQQNIGLLKSNLIGQFMVDEFRRIAVETILPTFMKSKQFKKIGEQIETKLLKKTSKQEVSINQDLQAQIIQEEMQELERDEAELFDDYMEFVMTYGYITLYAAAFPLSSAITVIFIYMELRSDLFKIDKLARRMNSRKVHSIGVWEYVLMAMSYFSIFTNIWLAFVASDQIDAIVPALKGAADFSKGSILVMLSVEHFMVLFVVVVHFLRDKDPKWLKIFKQRRQYRLSKH